MSARGDNRLFAPTLGYGRTTSSSRLSQSNFRFPFVSSAVLVGADVEDRPATALVMWATRCRELVVSQEVV